MKDLYKVTYNAIEHYVMADNDWYDEETGERMAIIADWDLSDEEVEALIKKFEENGYDLDEMDIYGERWMPWSEAIEGCNGFERIA